jgi:zinc protease
MCRLAIAHWKCDGSATQAACGASKIVGLDSLRESRFHQEVPVIHNSMKSSLKRFFAAACMCLMLGGMTLAQSSPAAAPASPTVDQILDRYLTVLGGRAAWEKLHSRTTLGRIEIPSENLSGTVMVHEKAPNRTLLVVILSGAAFRQGYDGKVGWMDDPQNGLREQSGAELAETARDADFYHPLDLKKLYTKFSTDGTAEINEHKCYIVEGAIPNGGVDKMYFDAESGLLRRFESQRHTEDGVSNMKEDLDDYRDVDGVKLPFEIHQSDEKSSFTIHVDQMQHNVDLDDSEFSKPAAQ